MPLNQGSFRSRELELCSLKEQYEVAIHWMARRNVGLDNDIAYLVGACLNRWFERVEEEILR